MKKCYQVRVNCMNMLEVCAMVDGTLKSIASERQLRKELDADGNVKSVKMESRKQCIERLCKELGIPA